MLPVLLGAGLRAAEMVGLDVTDLHADPDGGMVTVVRHRKGRRDHQVPLQPQLSQLLLTYLADTGRRLGDKGSLLWSHDRGCHGPERPRPGGETSIAPNWPEPHW
jgi:integrase